MKHETVYIALGSNLGDKRLNLIEALNQLREHVTIEQMSSIYETEPAYVTEQPRFYNMVLRGQTTRSPHALLRALKNIERRLGREQAARFGPRSIDLDILLYSDLRINTANLTVPHPRIAERAFVLVPLAEIAPELVIPGQTQPVSALLALLPAGGQGQVVRKIQHLAPQFTHDVQEDLPTAHLSLTRVGVSGLRRIVHLSGEKGSGLFYTEMDLFVQLRPDQKGAHMSRFSDTVEEIIDEIANERFRTLETLAERLAQCVLKDQRALRSDVRIRAQLPMRRHAHVSGKPTQEIYTLIGIAAATEARVAHLVGVEAEGMMACPCAQDMVATQAREQLAEIGFDAADINRIMDVVPVATHNQRGRGTLIVGTDQPIQAPDLVRIVENAMSSENYDLLKRPDELFVVTKAHRHPRFVEDAVREIIAGLVEMYPDLSDNTFVLAHQRNMETIHKHDVYAERMGTLGELRAEMTGKNYITAHTSLDAWLGQQLNHPGNVLPGSY